MRIIKAAIVTSALVGLTGVAFAQESGSGERNLESHWSSDSNTLRVPSQRSHFHRYGSVYDNYYAWPGYAAPYGYGPGFEFNID